MNVHVYVSEKCYLCSIRTAPFYDLGHCHFIHRQNQELEEKLQKMVTTAEDNKILINSHRTENMTLRENLKDLEVRYEC